MALSSYLGHEEFLQFLREMVADNKQTAHQRGGLDLNDTESIGSDTKCTESDSNSESDESSDVFTDSQEEDSPIVVEKKGKIITKKQRPGPSRKTTNKEKKDDSYSKIDGSSDWYTDTETQEDDSPVGAKQKGLLASIFDESDEGSDLYTDTQEEDSPVVIKQKGKIITKKQKPGPLKKTTNKEKKASSQKAPTEKPATNKRKNASDQCQKIPAKKPRVDKAGNGVGKENEISGVSTTNTNKQKPGASFKTNNKEKKASSMEAPTGIVGTNKRKNGQCQKMPPKQPRVDEVSTSIEKEDELSSSSTTNTNEQKPVAASKTNNKGKKATSKKFPTEKAGQCQKMPPKQPRVDEVSTSIGKEDELSGSSTTNTNKQKPGAASKTNNKEKKVKASSKKVPIERADQCQKMPPKQPGVDEVSASIGKEDELSGSSTTNTNREKPGATSKTNNKEKKALSKKVPTKKAASSKKVPTEKADQCQKMPPKQPSVDEVSTSIGKENELSGSSTTNANKQKPGAARKTNDKEKKASSKKVPTEKADQCQKMPPKQPSVDEVTTSIGKEDELSGSSTTNTNKQKPGAARKTNDKEKKASSKKVPTEKADQCQKMPPKQPSVDEVTTSIGKEDELSGSSTTNTNKQKPGAARKTNDKEKKASSKKVPTEKAEQCQKMPPKQPRVDEVSTSIGKEDELSGASSPQTAHNQKVKASRPRREKKKVKNGVPTMIELESLGQVIGDKWIVLGRRLKVAEPKLESIDACHKTLPEKGYQMLKHWAQKRGNSATYRVLSGALKGELLERTDLAERYCYG